MSQDTAAVDRRRNQFQFPLTLLPRAIRRDDNVGMSIGIGWLLAFPPSILLAALLSLVAPQSAQPEFEVGSYSTFFLIVVFAPIVETLIMGSVLLVMTRVASPTVAVLLSSLGWGMAHSLAAPAWGLVIWWPFLIFSTLFLVWSKRSFLAAIAVPATVHALQNLPSALLLLFFPDASI